MFKISLKTNDRLGVVAQLLEYLLSMHRTLGLMVNTLHKSGLVCMGPMFDL